MKIKVKRSFLSMGGQGDRLLNFLLHMCVLKLEHIISIPKISCTTFLLHSPSAVVSSTNFNTDSVRVTFHVFNAVFSYTKVTE